jgi:Avidin family
VASLELIFPPQDRCVVIYFFWRRCRGPILVAALRADRRRHPADVRPWPRRAVQPLIAAPADGSVTPGTGESFMKKFLLAFAILLGTQTFAMAQSIVASSLWKNQRGSTLVIDWTVPPGAAVFGGTFTNQAAGFECKGIPYAALGHANGDNVSFTVGFVKCATSVIWDGIIRGRRMYTSWNLTYYVNGVPKTLQGKDVFIQIH